MVSTIRASIPDPVRVDGRFLLRGAIDLDRAQCATGQLRVTDHKTGKNRTTPDWSSAAAARCSR